MKGRGSSALEHNSVSGCERNPRIGWPRSTPFIRMDAIEATWTMSESMLINDADFDPAPGAAADPLAIIGLLAETVRGRFVQRATVWIGLLGIDEVQFSGEDAFQAALADLCRRVRKGSIDPIRTPEQFRKSFAPRLRECLVDERRRQGAHKRGGGLVVNLLSVVMDESFDLADPHIRPPNQHLEAQDQANWLLSLLDREDESLRGSWPCGSRGKPTRPSPRTSACRSLPSNESSPRSARSGLLVSERTHEQRLAAKKPMRSQGLRDVVTSGKRRTLREMATLSPE